MSHIAIRLQHDSIVQRDKDVYNLKAEGPVVAGAGVLDLSFGPTDSVSSNGIASNSIDSNGVASNGDNLARAKRAPNATVAGQQSHPRTDSSNFEAIVDEYSA